jgi:hypothetical protein
MESSAQRIFDAGAPSVAVFLQVLQRSELHFILKS